MVKNCQEKENNAWSFLLTEIISSLNGGGIIIFTTIRQYLRKHKNDKTFNINQLRVKKASYLLFNCN